MSLPETEALVLAAMAQESRRRLLASVLAALAILVGPGVIIATAAHRQQGWMVTLAFALLAAALMFSKSRWTLLVAAAGSLALTLLGLSEAHALVPTIGMHCMLTELAVSVAPLLAILVATGMNHDPMRPLRLAQVALLAALAGQAALFLVCPAHDQSMHLLFFHNGGVLIAGLLAAGLAATRQPQ